MQMNGVLISSYLMNILTLGEGLGRSVNDGVVAVAEQLIRAWEVEACMPEVTSVLWLLLNAVAAADFCSRPHCKVLTNPKIPVENLHILAPIFELAGSR